MRIMSTQNAHIQPVNLANKSVSSCDWVVIVYTCDTCMLYYTCYAKNNKFMYRIRTDETFRGLHKVPRLTSCTWQRHYNVFFCSHTVACSRRTCLYMFLNDIWLLFTCLIKMWHLKRPKSGGWHEQHWGPPSKKVRVPTPMCDILW